MEDDFYSVRANLIRALMAEQDPGKELPWRGGKAMVKDVLKELLAGGDHNSATVHVPTPSQGGAAPSGSANIEPSQRAVDRLSQEHYDALQRGDAIPGMTRPYTPTVSWRVGGGHTSRLLLNDDGSVERGTPTETDMMQQQSQRRLD